MRVEIANAQFFCCLIFFKRYYDSAFLKHLKRNNFGSPYSYSTMCTYPCSCWHVADVVSSGVTLISETQIAKASTQAHPCSFKILSKWKRPSTNCKMQASFVLRLVTSACTSFPFSLCRWNHFPKENHLCCNKWKSSTAIIADSLEKKKAATHD